MELVDHGRPRVDLKRRVEREPWSVMLYPIERQGQTATLYHFRALEP
jgi:hypothetical protein